jgi:1-deoxy-D-xylulose-5-phosphate reductoisomerase
MKSIALLGSTGSVGRSTLDLVSRWDGRFRVAALGAGRNVELLEEQVRRFQPSLVSMSTEEGARELRRRLGGPSPEIVVGEEGARAVATESEAQIVVGAIVGAAGLGPTLGAVEAGRTVALANKESLVVAGELVTAAAERSGARLLPVDSEHNAVHQCLRSGEEGELRRLVLTASGGPFRQASAREIAEATPEQALAHPTWDMGPKISIDSATLMNKGLEVIEARWLFGVGPGSIDVVVHPQSIVHSMVELLDGSFIAQLGPTDMRHPIQYALTWPERWETVLPRLDPTELGRLDFEAPDTERFPCLALAYRALEEGGHAPAVLNAANEVAVEAFLASRLSLPGIAAVVEDTLAACGPGPAAELEQVLAADRNARRIAGEAAERRAEVAS